jgi:hypothetical protein
MPSVDATRAEKSNLKVPEAMTHTYKDRAISGRLSPPSSHGFEMTLLTAKIPKPCPAARSCSFRMPRKFWGGRNSFKSSPRGPTWCSFKPAATKCSADVAGEIFSSRRSPNIKNPQCYAKSQVCRRRRMNSYDD